MWRFQLEKQNKYWNVTTVQNYELLYFLILREKLLLQHGIVFWYCNFTIVKYECQSQF